MTSGDRPRVPFIDLSRLVAEVRGDVERDFAACLEACELVGGPRVAELERVLARQLGVPHVVACGSGTDALVIGLLSQGVRPGMKIAVPNLTFWATFEAVVRVGAIPVLVDVDAGDLQMSLDELRRAHRELGLDGAILVHLFGWASARLGDIRELCRSRGIRLLEDGAQAYGVRVNGEPVLAGASVGTASFYPAKVIGGAMDGGAMTFADAEAAARARSLCNHGRSAHYAHAEVGFNSRMGGLQAAFLLRVCAMSERIVASRRAAADAYRELLAGEPSLRVHAAPPGVVENGYLSVVTSSARGGVALHEALAARGIGAARTYPSTIDAQPPAASALRVGDLATSRGFCPTVVNPPLFFGIRRDEIALAAAALREAARMPA